METPLAAQGCDRDFWKGLPMESNQEPRPWFLDARLFVGPGGYN